MISRESHEVYTATSSRPHAKQLQLWQLIVFAYMVWPGLSIRITLNVTPLQVKFAWNHQFWCVLGVRAVTDAFLSFCLLAEIQSYGLRPPSRFQVLLCFGDECLDPQRQRRTLTVQVTAAPEFNHWLWSRDLSFFSSFCLWGSVKPNIYWEADNKFELVFLKSKLRFERFKVECWNFKVWAEKWKIGFESLNLRFESL